MDRNKRTEPRVLNKYTKHKIPWVFPREYVMRPSKWGNPFVIGRDGTREEVVAKYEAYLLANETLLSQLHELTGKDLICCCAPKPCHADVLVKHSNKPEVIARAKEALEKRKNGSLAECLTQVGEIPPPWLRGRTAEANVQTHTHELPGNL